MGFLNPQFLLAGAAIAIPLLIHLLHRQRVREFVFPALRYLKRTERDHSRRVKIRQLWVLLLRIAALLVLALAGARPFVRGLGSAHPPTALAIVLDNSASSGAIIGDERVLDRLKAHARATVQRANDQDRIWVVGAGTPWTVAAPGSREDALRAIDQTELSDAAGDLNAAVSRVTSLVAASDLPAREVHVVSDLQSSALGISTGDSVKIVEGVPVLVLRPDWTTPDNGSVSEVLVGGGLAPIVGLPTDVTARIGEALGADTVDTRLWVGEEVRGAARATPGAEVVFPVPTVGTGVISGFVERDPDALRSDDRRYFSAAAATPPVIATDGASGPFLADALDVLRGSGRISRNGGSPQVLLALEGRGIRAVGAVADTWIILPPDDPTRLPALNQRLRAAAVPWQFVEAPTVGTRRMVARDFPHSLDEVAVQRAYRLQPDDGTPSGTVHAELEDGEAWMVSGTAGPARFLLLASPLDPEWSNLPLSSLMIPTFEWALGTWARQSADQPVLLAGQRFGLPAGVSSLAGPEGTLVPVEDPAAGVILDRAGLYDLLGGDGPVTLLGRVAVNVPSGESDLAPASDAMARAAFGADAEVISADQWERRAFTERQGPEIWRSLLVALLVILVLESLVAASGRAEPETPTAAA